MTVEYAKKKKKKKTEIQISLTYKALVKLNFFRRNIFFFQVIAMCLCKRKFRKPYQMRLFLCMWMERDYDNFDGKQQGISETFRLKFSTIYLVFSIK